MRYIARTLTSWARSHRSRSIVSTVPPTTIVPTPALLKRTLTRPHAALAPSTTAPHSSGLARSATSDSASPPAWRTARMVCASSSPRTSVRNRRAPAWAKSVALARPMPVAAPVMIATLPVRVAMDTLLAAVSNPRIEVPVQHVDRQGEGHEHHGDEQDGRLRQGIVTLVDRPQHEPSHTWEREDFLDHDGSAEEDAYLQPRHRHDRDQRIAEPVLEDDEPAAQPLGRRRA